MKKYFALAALLALPSAVQALSADPSENECVQELRAAYNTNATPEEQAAAYAAVMKSCSEKHDPFDLAPKATREEAKAQGADSVIGLHTEEEKIQQNSWQAWGWEAGKYVSGAVAYLGFGWLKGLANSKSSKK